MRNAHVINALDKLVDVSLLLGRIFVIHVIQIDMHHAHRLRFTYLRNLAGKALQRGVIRDQHAWNIVEKRGIRQPFVERECHLIAMIFSQV